MNLRRFREILASLPAGGRILDAGCGTGNNSRFIHRLRPDLVFHGVDIHPFPASGLPEYVRFDIGDVEHLERYGDGLFDCVVCFHVLEHLQAPDRAAEEFHRILKPGGIVVAESPHWISAVTPVGTNFHDDPTHVRPFGLRGFRELFSGFRILHAAVEPSVHFHLAEIHGIDRDSPGFLARRLLNRLGIYRTAVFLIARK